MFDFAPQSSEEMVIHLGEILRVTEREGDGDGWSKGESVSTQYCMGGGQGRGVGRIGLFPTSYTQTLP